MNKTEVLHDLIASRRSIYPKDYTDKTIPEHILEKILKSADFAPSHKKTKPWRMLTFRGEAKDELGEILASIYRDTTPPETFLEKKYADINLKILKADTVVAICVNFSGIVPEWEEIAATAMAVQNMYLTCTAYGIGCYWSTPSLKNHLGAFLKLDSNQKCLGLFYMGSISK